MNNLLSNGMRYEFHLKDGTVYVGKFSGAASSTGDETWVRIQDTDFTRTVFRESQVDYVISLKEDENE